MHANLEVGRAPQQQQEYAKNRQRPAVPELDRIKQFGITKNENIYRGKQKPAKRGTSRELKNNDGV